LKISSEPIYSIIGICSFRGEDFQFLGLVVSEEKIFIFQLLGLLGSEEKIFNCWDL
jgi:hypothetical protein